MRWIAVVTAVLVGCGGGSKTGPDEPDDPAGGEPAELSDEDKLYRSQLATCGPMCERITQCSVEQARAQLSDEELAELDLENTAPEHTRRCEQNCGASRLSPRQITVMRECVNGPQECGAYLDCLDQAKKGGG